MNELISSENNPNNAVPDDVTYVNTMLQSVVDKLRKFFEQRQNVLSPKDVQCVSETIVAAQYLGILLNEDEQRYKNPSLEQASSTIGTVVIVNWKEDPRTISVVEIAQVYHTLRSVVASIYLGQQTPKKKSWLWRS